MEFVNFSTAKKLKEKGFPQIEKNTLAMYDADGEWYSLASTIGDTEYWFYDFDMTDCVCPTISQVLKWLRKKEVYLSVKVIETDYAAKHWTGIMKFGYNVIAIIEPKLRHKHYDSVEYDTYEEAALAGIEYVLDRVL